MALALRRMGVLMSAGRNIHTTAPSSETFKEKLFRIEFKFGDHRKYGLLRDDRLREICPDVKEAVSRLPEDVQMKRLYRAIRAQQLLIEHNILPKEEWTSEDHEDNDYLQPYLAEVVAEREERENWEKNH